MFALHFWLWHAACINYKFSSVCVCTKVIEHTLASLMRWIISCVQADHLNNDLLFQITFFWFSELWIVLSIFIWNWPPFKVTVQVESSRSHCYFWQFFFFVWLLGVVTQLLPHRYYGKIMHTFAARKKCWFHSGGMGREDWLDTYWLENKHTYDCASLYVNNV